MTAPGAARPPAAAGPPAATVCAPLGSPADGSAPDGTVVLTPEVLGLAAWLQRVHGPALEALLRAREERALLAAGGEPLDLPAGSAAVRAAHWQVAPAPPDLRDRRVEITGPAEAKMILSALGSGARVFMADLEDALSPTWPNVTAGYAALSAAAAGSLTHTRDDGTVTVMPTHPATLCVRPRGLHLPEPHVEVDGAPVSAALLDVAALAVLCGPALLARGSGLYLYLPKLQAAPEAQWWDAVLADVERRAGLPYRSVRVTVLVEHVLAALEMEELLFALRDRVTGLNAGRWDYLFSIIKVLGEDPAHLLPDRLAVTMRAPFLAAYAQRLVAVCHRRGAAAIGGMSAAVPDRRDPVATQRALAAVREDKEREAGLGYDGTWVAHPDLVSVATAAFEAVLGGAADQRDVRPDPGAVAALLDTTVPGARCTAAGLRGDVSVGLRYVASWLAGRGAVALDGLMEDTATAEIARCQLWQWVHHGVVLDDGRTVTADLVRAETAAEVKRLAGRGGDLGALRDASDVLLEVALTEPLLPFLTLAAVDRLG